MSKKRKKVSKTSKTQPKKRKKKSTLGRILKYIFAIIIFIGLFGGLKIGSMYMEYIKNAPELNITQRRNFSMATTIYNKDGEFLAMYPGVENIDWVEYDEIPQQLIDAFVSIEDKRFFDHPGVDWRRTLSAVLEQLKGNSGHGGSTITQQLIKNTHLSSARTYERKAQEIHLALQLERVLSKEEILEWYMNIIYLGEANYGVRNAARDYFGKELSELTLRECAMLAGLPQSPSYYNPRANYLAGDMTPTNNRTDTVLYTMHENGLIDDYQYGEALHDTVEIKPSTDRLKLYDYPTYVEYAVEDAAKDVLKLHGVEITKDSIADMKIKLRESGYQIYTAFDKNIQDIVQETAANYTNYPQTLSEKQAEFSTVIMNQHNGRVVAMVGGREEATIADGYNRCTDSVQAVGSSMKPLSVYAPALDLGYYPGTTVMDYPEPIPGFDTEEGYPGGETNNAMITMRRALELSHNIPAVRFILDYVHLDRSYAYLVNNGFAKEHLSQSPAGMGLGADGVTTLEMTAAYATLANGGVYNEPHAVVKITDRFGNVIFDETMVESHRVFKESTAWLITDMLEGNMVNGLGINARLSNMHSAGKTGTHERKVISFGGYTPYYTSFLRISSDDYADLVNPTSYIQSAGLWKQYMEKIHEGLQDRPIQDKTSDELGIQKFWVCSNSGMLANEDCAGYWEYAAVENAPVEHCYNHWYPEAPAPQTEEYGWWDENGEFHYY